MVSVRRIPGSERRLRASPSAWWQALAGLVVSALASTALCADDTLPSVRRIELSLADDEAIPHVSIGRSAVATVAFTDADGTPWPISALHVSDGGPTIQKQPSHPHVATLQGRTAKGNVVALLEGLTQPVHLAVYRDATPTSPIRVTIARSRHRMAANAPRTAAASPPRDAIEQIVREYLLANPGLIRDALDPARQLADNVRDMRDEIIGHPEVPAAGDLSGDVTVVEFFDYSCGYCKRSLEAVRAALAHEGVRVELREYPILGAGSTRAAQLALAASVQGRYLDAHLALMERAGGYESESLPEELASSLGLDAARLRQDMESPDVDARIEANRRLAGRLGVTGTPAFLFLGPESVEVAPGSIDASRMAEMISSVQ